LAQVPEGNKTMREIANVVDLTEAPEDAVCSLVIDLLQYCEREKIDWYQEVILRARRQSSRASVNKAQSDGLAESQRTE
jgi:hypothetical protein